MKYYLIKMLTNQQEQDGSTISVFSTLDAAKVAYHQTLANYHNAPDVRYAVVQIVNELGYAEMMEVVDHTPEPEPTPEVTITSITKEGNVYTVTYSDGTVVIFKESEEPEPEITEES